MLSLTICGILVLIATVNANAGPKVTDQVRAFGILFYGIYENEKVKKLRKSSDFCDKSLVCIFFVFDFVVLKVTIKIIFLRCGYFYLSINLLLLDKDLCKFTGLWGVS